MGTSVKRTPYQAIPFFARSLKLYNIDRMLHIDRLVEAMKDWNLYGSAKLIENWVDRMYDRIEEEYDAKPLGLMDWETIDEYVRL